MATNPPAGDNHRNGAVRNRSQFKNDRTGQYVKRDTQSGRFMDNSKHPFKGVRREKQPLGSSNRRCCAKPDTLVLSE